MDLGFEKNRCNEKKCATEAMDGQIENRAGVQSFKNRDFLIRFWF